MGRLTSWLLLLRFVARSDIARPYPPGQEPAKGGQDLARHYPAGQEKAHVGNANLSRNYGDISR